MVDVLAFSSISLSGQRPAVPVTLDLGNKGGGGGAGWGKEENRYDRDEEKRSFPCRLALVAGLLCGIELRGHA